MGKITVVNNITLDGVMQAPGGPDEDTRDGFTQGGWAHPYQDKVIAQKMSGLMAGAKGALLLGRRTYEQFYSFWPKQRDNPFTVHLNNVRKYVVSNTLKEPLPWENSVLLTDITRLKALKEDMTILGSGVLIRSLMEEKLIDEFVLLIFPLTLGSGHRLFPGGVPSELCLTETLTSDKGVIIATYQTAGT